MVTGWFLRSRYRERTFGLERWRCGVQSIVRRASRPPCVAGSFAARSLELTGKQVEARPASIGSDQDEIIQQQTLSRFDGSHWSYTALFPMTPAVREEHGLWRAQAEDSHGVSESLEVPRRDDIEDLARRPAARTLPVSPVLIGG